MLKWKYPKFFFLFLSFLVAYALVRYQDISSIHSFVSNMGYLGTFLSGMFLSYGFTAATGAAILLITAKSQNIFLASIIGGIGGLCADLIIFNVLRYSFADELKKFSREKIVKEMGKRTPKKIKKYVLLAFAGLIIASPLPDEIGVSLLAASRTISQRVFALVSFVLSTAGIFVILLIGRMI